MRFEPVVRSVTLRMEARAKLAEKLLRSLDELSDEEIEQARAQDFHIVTLGGRMLRAETAAISVTALLQHLFGDLR